MHAPRPRPAPLLLIKQIRPTTAQIDNLGATIAILLEARALEAVEGVADALAAADDALVLVVAEGALVADARQRRRPHVRVAHGALAVALVAQSPDVDPRQLAAHHEVRVVARHGPGFAAEGMGLVWRGSGIRGSGIVWLCGVSVMGKWIDVFYLRISWGGVKEGRCQCRCAAKVIGGERNI